jgi:hypothetical protein
MDINEPAIEFKESLSNGAYKLLNKLILDLNSKLPPNERVYRKQDNASLMHNLFIGNYDFSYKYHKEVYTVLSTNL